MHALVHGGQTARRVKVSENLILLVGDSCHIRMPSIECVVARTTFGALPCSYENSSVMVVFNYVIGLDLR